MKLIKYQAKIEKDTDGYTVTFPDLQGCISCGDTLADALKNAKEALDLYLEEAQDPAWKIPLPKTRQGKGYFWISPSPEIAFPITIRLMRIGSKLSQNLLAKKMNLKVQQVQKLEYVKKSNPTMKTMVELASELGYELSFVKKQKAS